MNLPQPEYGEIKSTCPQCGKEEVLVFVGERSDEARLLYLGLPDGKPLVRYCGHCEVEMRSTLRFQFAS